MGDQSVELVAEFQVELVSRQHYFGGWQLAVLHQSQAEIEHHRSHSLITDNVLDNNTYMKDSDQLFACAEPIGISSLQWGQVFLIFIHLSKQLEWNMCLFEQGSM